jgi:hypothetical protein
MLGLVANTQLQFQNYQQQVFSAGKKRFVHVLRSAIIANVRENKSYPTVVVVEDDKKQLFHVVKVSGVLKYDYQGDVEAKVYIETEEEIIGFTDSAVDGEYTVPSQPKNWFIEKVFWFSVFKESVERSANSRLYD